MGTKTTTKSMDPLTQEIIRGIYDTGMDLYNQGATGYVGDLTAGLTDLGASAIEGYTGLDLRSGEFDEAIDKFRGVMNLTDEDLARRRSEYAQNYSGAVLDPAMRAFDRRADIARSTEAGEMTKALGSAGFGASRRGVAESELDLARDVARGELGAKIGADALTYGTNQLASDLGLRTGAASALAGTAGAALGSELSGLSAMLGAGELERGISQSGLDALYNEFIRQQTYPLTAFGMLAGVPYGQGYGTTKERDPSRVLEAIGSFGKGFPGIFGAP
jgi:hypothetical protein